MALQCEQYGEKFFTHLRKSATVAMHFSTWSDLPPAVLYGFVKFAAFYICHERHLYVVENCVFGAVSRYFFHGLWYEGSGIRHALCTFR